MVPVLQMRKPLRLDVLPKVIQTDGTHETPKPSFGCAQPLRAKPRTGHRRSGVWAFIFPIYGMGTLIPTALPS